MPDYQRPDAREVERQGIIGTNIPPQIADEIIKVVSISAAKGQNPMNCQAVKLIPDDFEWPEYDKWQAKFEEQCNWPDSWDASIGLFAFQEETEDMDSEEAKEEERKLMQAVVAPKKQLYQHWLMVGGMEANKLNEWRTGGIKRVELVPCPDSCSFCQELAGDYDISKAPLSGSGLHPGCRCSYRPAASEC